MSNFEKWDNEFRAQNLYAFNGNENALLYLKVRAVCRGKQIKQFIEKNSIEAFFKYNDPLGIQA